MEMIDINTLNKHLLVGTDGATIFVFEPEKAVTLNPSGEGFILNEDAEFLDFLATMDIMGLERTEGNACALATVLFERRESGDEELAKFA